MEAAGRFEKMATWTITSKGGNVVVESYEAAVRALAFSGREGVIVASFPAGGERREPSAISQAVAAELRRAAGVA